jgi:hypothetical protein
MHPPESTIIILKELRLLAVDFPHYQSRVKGIFIRASIHSRSITI